MLTYMIICSEDRAAAERKVSWAIKHHESLIPFMPSHGFDWTARHCSRSVRVLAWVNDPAGDGQRYVKLLGDCIELHEGWRVDHDGTTIGEFLNLRIDGHGDGVTRRSIAPVYPIYVGRHDGVTIVANRALLAAAALNERSVLDLDQDHFACTIACGFPLGTRSLFAGVRALRHGEEPTFSSGSVAVGALAADPWNAPELAEHYANDSEGFWNDRISELNRVADMYFDDAGEPLIEKFSLSGGKDSRLLFAVLHQREGFRHVPIHTHGAPYSSDVIVAAQIAQHYGMEHTVSDSVFQKIELNTRLPEHLFLSEGRSSPSDLTTWRARRQPGIQVFGHELGLRDVIPGDPDAYTVEGTMKQLSALFGGFDRLGVLQSDVKARLVDKVREEIARLYDVTAKPENVAWRFYMENRVMHYLANVKFKDESLKDAPWPLMIDPVVKSAYSLGLQARLEERMHYEIQRRLSPWLTYQCPFGSQRWPLRLRIAEGGVERFDSPIPAYSSRRAPPKGTYAAFESSRNEFRTFVMDNISKIGNLVDRSRVEVALSRPYWDSHQMNALWYIVQICGSVGADWLLLSPINRRQRPAYFPPVVYSNVRSETAALDEHRELNKIYQDVLPTAAYALSRDHNAKELLRDAHEMWSSGLKSSAFNRYAAAAALGDAFGHFFLGRAYLNGEFVPKDVASALVHLDVARERGNASAMALLARTYESGNGVASDVVYAEALYREAVAAGDFWSYERLALLLERTGRDAKNEWTRLCEGLEGFLQTRETAHAHYMLGLILAEGKGAGVDLTRARQHLSRAADLGSRAAVAKLPDLEGGSA